MAPSCAVCAFRFEREQGYFLGAIYVSWAATGVIVTPVCVTLYFAGVSLTYQLIVAAALCVLVPLLFFRHSRSLWMAMDYFFEPEGTPQLPAAERSVAIPRDEPIRVDCYAGSRAEETPRRLWTGDRWHDLTVLARWVSEPAESAHRIHWFRIRLESGPERLIYHDEGLDLWFWRRG